MSTLSRQQIADDARAGLARVLEVTDAHPGEGLGEAYLERTTTDVLAHVHGWHGLFTGWIAAHDAGEDVAYPAEGFTWRDLDRLNEALYQAHRGRDYGQVRDALLASHDEALAIVARLTDAELATPDAFPWAGGEPLAAVAHECLGAHYAWALDTLEAARLDTH